MSALNNISEEELNKNNVWIYDQRNLINYVHVKIKII